MSDWPVSSPTFGPLLLDRLRADRDEQGRKPKAFETFARYSDAGWCARSIALDAAGDEPEAFDDASMFVSWLGTLGHEDTQTAVALRYLLARFEIPTSLGVTSGHCDIDCPEEDALVEIKFVNGTKFAFAIGVDRRSGKRTNPKGPNLSHKIQAALNAKALGREKVVLLYFAFESPSKRVRRVAGLSDLDAVCAEWHYPREEWEPLADAELDRLGAIQATYDAGFLADRHAVDDDGSLVLLDPEATRTPWNCDYCAHARACVELGPGVVPIPVDLLQRREAS